MKGQPYFEGCYRLINCIRIRPIRPRAFPRHVFMYAVEDIGLAETLNTDIFGAEALGVSFSLERYGRCWRTVVTVSSFIHSTTSR